MSTYDSYEPPSRFGLYLLIAVIVASLASFVFCVFYINRAKEEQVTSPRVEKTVEAPKMVKKKAEEDPFDVQPKERIMPEDSVMPATAEEILEDLGIGVEELDPESLLKKIGASLEAGEIKQAATLIGKDALSENHLLALRKLSDSGKLKLHSNSPVTEIGELEANRRSRWALNLGDEDERIYFELLRMKTGGWKIDKVSLPEKSSKAVFVDSLGITDAFLQSALDQSFDDAKSFVDSSKVSDAKIAGLCIIFEEAKYRLRKKKPLRAMFNRDKTAGFMAHVENSGGEKAAEFGVSVQRESPESPWRITEINLDSLLADYADRVAGGDVHFTPLVKNPGGGDTLILYFGFDEDGLTPRTQRQLDIVAGLLKLDSGKKLTLSGHTDSLGSDNYNNQLSGRRAGAVEIYLLKVGVPKSQIITQAEGEAKPRRPNATATGEDDPTGRRANRRTEIYLDF